MTVAFLVIALGLLFALTRMVSELAQVVRFLIHGSDRADPAIHANRAADPSSYTKVRRHPVLRWRYMESANGSKNHLNEAIILSGRQRKWIAARLDISRVTLHRWAHEGHAVPEEQQKRLIALLFPEIPEPDREAKRCEVFPEEAVVGA